MYSYVKGIIKDITPTTVIIDVHDIGYEVITPNPYSFKVETEDLIYVHHYLREDNEALYGFKTKDERKLFIQLLSVKGIGPKSATAILATGNVNDVIGAIEIGNVKFLSKFPGIGPKASQQIILDLKGKIDLEEPTIVQSNNISEVEQALRSLGYNKRQTKKVIAKLDHTKPTDQLIKDALSKMLQ